MTARGEPLRTADQRAREAACTWFEGPISLEAGAGTGKTAVLVARVLFWLLGPGWERASSGAGAEDRDIAGRVVDRVVAITFTERAAAEMAERIAGALSRLASGDPVVGFPRDRLELTSGQVRKRAPALLAALDRLVVGTIHAFCRRLLAAHPLEAGLHPNFGVDADGRALRRVVESVLSDKLQQAYGVPGDPDLVALAALGFGPATIADEVERLAAEATPPAALEGDPYHASAVDAAAQRLQQTATRVVGALQRVTDPEEPDERASRLLRYGAALAASAGEAASLEGLVAVAEAAEVERLLTGARAVLQRAGDAGGPEARQALGEAVAELRAQIRCLRSVQPAVLPRACRVIGVLLREVYCRSRARGIVGFGRLLEGARDLLQSHPTILARLRRSIDQLLVDEFQDTDPLQCEIVQMIALQGTGPGPGLMIVGDPKQSIYGWRQADLAAYEAFVAEVEARGGRRHQLAVNFRSRAEILEEVRRIIEPVMKPVAGLQPAFQRLLPAAEVGEEPADGPAVEYWISWATDGVAQGAKTTGDSDPSRRTRAEEARRIEAEALAADLRRLHDLHGVPWQRIAILQRTTTAQDIYLGALRRAEIPYAVERDRSYYRRKEVIEAVALVRTIADPNDQLALLTLLRSAMVGVPDAALLPLWGRDLPEQMAELVRPDPQRLERLNAAIDCAAQRVPRDAPGVEAVPRWPTALKQALGALAQLRQALEEEPLDQMMDRLRDLLLPEEIESARFLGPHRLANVQRFLAGFAEGLQEVDAGVDALLRELRGEVSRGGPEESAISGEPALDAVRVMTIHKAKGLTFDHVYLVGLHGRSGRADERAGEAVLVDGRWALRLLGVPDLRFDLVLDRRRRVAAAEAIRTLYVALTRPRQRLVLAGRWPLLDPPPAPEAARSHVELLLHRQGPRPDLLQLVAGAGAETTTADGARWLLCDRLPVPPGVRGRPTREPVITAEEARQEIERLGDLCRAAREQQARPLCRAVSAEAAKEAEEAQLEGLELQQGEEGRPPATVPLAIGTAVHHLLERIDLSLPTEPALDRLRSSFKAELSRLGPADRDAALAEGRWWLEHLRRSPLLERLRGLRGRIVAREMPLLLRASPGQQGATAALVGTVDLLYLDPESDRFVVVDYKTDRVRFGGLQRRTEAHRAQGRLYSEAVGAALDAPQPPRFELWYLAPGIVVQGG